MMRQRRSTARWILSVVFAGSVLLLTVSALASEGSQDHPIDRRALVTRHDVTLEKPDPLTPLTVGNGGFAFTADITGLQTFPDYYEQGVPLCTQSQWGWHTLADAVWLKLSDALEEYEVAGRKVPYASGGQPSGGYSPVASSLRANPHRLHLGRIGLQLTKADGSAGPSHDAVPCRWKPCRLRPNPRPHLVLCLCRLVCWWRDADKIST